MLAERGVVRGEPLQRLYLIHANCCNICKLEEKRMDYKKAGVDIEAG